MAPRSRNETGTPRFGGLGYQHIREVIVIRLHLLSFHREDQVAMAVQVREFHVRIVVNVGGRVRPVDHILYQAGEELTDLFIEIRRGEARGDELDRNRPAPVTGS